MYSIVLMAAIGGGPNTAGGDVIAAPVVGGCAGCFGYAGGCYGGSSCFGSCYGSCHGGGRGCHGGGFFGHKSRGGCHGCRGGGGLFGHHRASCNGCYGSSCFGSSCWGSCHGGGYGGGCFGGGGCYGAGCAGGGIYPAYSYPAYGVPAGPVIVTPPAGTEVPAAPAPTDKDKKGKGGEGNSASLKFQLPADAKLYVDGQPTAGTGAERAFFTPTLVPGQKYFYDVKAEITVAGQVVVEERRVIVEAGAEVTESFAKLFAAVGQPAPAVASK
jgi:uncharacterized protein (TIGR03000 family)